MHRTTREKIVDLLVEDTPESRRKLDDLLRSDPFARSVYKEEEKIFILEKYLQNQLSDTEKKHLENLLRDDPSMQKELKLRRQVDNFTNLLPVMEAVNKANTDYENEELGTFYSIKKELSRKNKTPFIKWVVAASIVLLVGIGGIVKISSGNTPITQELFADYYKPLNDESVEKYMSESQALQEAKIKYYQEDYHNAWLIFRNLPNSLDIETEKNFYMGLSLMELGDYEKAISAFNQVVEKRSFESLSHAYWYLGLCYLHVGQKNKAVEVFNYIAESDGFNSDKARKILKKLH